MDDIARVYKDGVATQVGLTRIDRFDDVANPDGSDIPTIFEKSGGKNPARHFVKCFSGIIPSTKDRCSACPLSAVQRSLLFVGIGSMNDLIFHYPFDSLQNIGLPRLDLCHETVFRLIARLVRSHTRGERRKK